MHLQRPILALPPVIFLWKGVASAEVWGIPMACMADAAEEIPYNGGNSIKKVIP
jgi:hypothetical protein